MMVPKIITHAASVVAHKTDCVRVLGRTRSNSKRHPPPPSLLGSSTNVPATGLEKRLRTAQSNRTQGYAAHFWTWQLECLVVCSINPFQRVVCRC